MLARLLDALVFALGPALMCGIGVTLRIRTEGDEALHAHLDAGGRAILCGWHQRILGGVWYFRRYAPAIMISQSHDGERVARVVGALGWTTVRGSSSRGGVRALLELVRRVRAGAVGAHIVDGPRGPAREVKPGLLLAAQRAGAAIVPVCLHACWRVELGSWDRMHVPLPFSRVLLRFGAPIEVPKDASPAELESLRERIEKTLASGHAALDATA